MLQNCTLVCNKKLVSWIIVILQCLVHNLKYKYLWKHRALFFYVLVYEKPKKHKTKTKNIFGICFVFNFSMSKHIWKIFFKVKFFFYFFEFYECIWRSLAKKCWWNNKWFSTGELSINVAKYLNTNLTLICLWKIKNKAQQMRINV